MDPAVEHLYKADPILGRIIESSPFPEYRNTHNLYEDLVSCILDMRIHYAGSNAAFRYKRFKKLIGGDPITPDLIQNIDQKIWAQLKLSFQKDDSIKLLTEKWTSDNWDQINWVEIPQEELEEKLSQIKGIGKWTLLIIRLFSLEEEDIFPSGDYQLKKAMCEIYSLEENKKTEEKIRKIAEKWKPYRSLATRYLWRWRQAK